jgi:hypothetical protein
MIFDDFSIVLASIASFILLLSLVVQCGIAISNSCASRLEFVDMEVTEPKNKRKQVSKACESCRRSKVACSNERPCARCVSHGIADQCVDHLRKRKRISASTDESKSTAHPRKHRRTRIADDSASNVTPRKKKKSHHHHHHHHQHSTQTHNTTDNYPEAAPTTTLPPSPSPSCPLPPTTATIGAIDDAFARSPIVIVSCNQHQITNAYDQAPGPTACSHQPDQCATNLFATDHSTQAILHSATSGCNATDTSRSPWPTAPMHASTFSPTTTNISNDKHDQQHDGMLIRHQQHDHHHSPSILSPPALPPEQCERVAREMLANTTATINSSTSPCSATDNSSTKHRLSYNAQLYDKQARAGSSDGTIHQVTTCHNISDSMMTDEHIEECAKKLTDSNHSASLISHVHTTAPPLPTHLSSAYRSVSPPSSPPPPPTTTAAATTAAAESSVLPPSISAEAMQLQYLNDRVRFLECELQQTIATLHQLTQHVENLWIRTV